jgi:ribosomal protein S18 acetylase RimI-like enzyme
MASRERQRPEFDTANSGRLRSRLAKIVSGADKGNMPPITDPAEIRSLLQTDRSWAVYALGDLEPPHFARSHWWRAPRPAVALALVYAGFEPEPLFLLGRAEHAAGLLDEIGNAKHLYLHVRPEMLPSLQERFRIPAPKRMWRMVLDPARFEPKPADSVLRLGPADLLAIQDLYDDGKAFGEAPDFFALDMLKTGVFFGVRAGVYLIAAAGTHLVAPAEDVAAIGNIYTRRDRRGRGLGAVVTSAVTAELGRRGIGTIALNVHQENAPAIRIYERLGFVRYCEFVEGIAIPRELPEGAHESSSHVCRPDGGPSALADKWPGRPGT